MRLLTQSTDRARGKQRWRLRALQELLAAEGETVGVTLANEVMAEWRRQRLELLVPRTARPRLDLRRRGPSGWAVGTTQTCRQAL